MQEAWTTVYNLLAVTMKESSRQKLVIKAAV
jgi:hypothetical protein